MRKIVITFLLLLSAHANATTCDTKETIKFAGLDWDSNAFHVATARYILEHGYGCKTDEIPGSILPMLTALGRGDVHIAMEIWQDNVTEAWDKIERAGQAEIVGPNFPDAIQGFYVPRYLVEGDAARKIKAKAPNLKSVDDLVKHKMLFQDPEQPKKGRFYNCILGWNCETINTKKLSVYGLDNHYVNFRPGTGAALAAAIASHYERGEPFLAYYWGPSWILGKYDLLMLEEPPFNREIWIRLGKEKNPKEATAYPLVTVAIGVNSKFAQSAPNVIAFLKKYRTTNAIVSEALAYMQEDKSRKAVDAAKFFLRNQIDKWEAWVSVDAAQKIKAELEIKDSANETWSLEIDQPINEFVTYLVKSYEPAFSAIATPIRKFIVLFESLLNLIPWWLFLLFAGAATFSLTRSAKLAVVISFCFLLIAALGLWHQAMQTLALMIVSVLVSLVAGVPVGILLSQFDRLRTITLPILDAMQTMPSFVYLIPALMLFGLGKVPALFATVIYAISPLIRLTDLGIRQVDPHVVEASRSFGASRSQILRGVQLPLALPTVMAGINQATMLALSMVVIASMIGARGLGEQVLLGIQKLDVGKGFTAGVGIVALAIILDRTTQAIGKRWDPGN